MGGLQQPGDLVWERLEGKCGLGILLPFPVFQGWGEEALPLTPTLTS